MWHLSEKEKWKKVFFIFFFFIFLMWLLSEKGKRRKGFAMDFGCEMTSLFVILFWLIFISIWHPRPRAGTLVLKLVLLCDIYLKKKEKERPCLGLWLWYDFISSNKASSVCDWLHWSGIGALDLDLTSSACKGRPSTLSWRPRPWIGNLALE